MSLQVDQIIERLKNSGIDNAEQRFADFMSGDRGSLRDRPLVEAVKDVLRENGAQSDIIRFEREARGDEVVLSEKLRQFVDTEIEKVGATVLSQDVAGQSAEERFDGLVASLEGQGFSEADLDALISRDTDALRNEALVSAVSEGLTSVRDKQVIDSMQRQLGDDPDAYGRELSEFLSATFRDEDAPEQLPQIEKSGQDDSLKIAMIAGLENAGYSQEDFLRLASRDPDAMRDVDLVSIATDVLRENGFDLNVRQWERRADSDDQQMGRSVGNFLKILYREDIKNGTLLDRADEPNELEQGASASASATAGGASNVSSSASATAGDTSAEATGLSDVFLKVHYKSADEFVQAVPPRGAHKQVSILQDTLNQAGSDLKVDGLMGPKTSAELEGVLIKARLASEASVSGGFNAAAREYDDPNLQLVVGYLTEMGVDVDRVERFAGAVKSMQSDLDDKGLSLWDQSYIRGQVTIDREVPQQKAELGAPS